MLTSELVLLTCRGMALPITALNGFYCLSLSMVSCEGNLKRRVVYGLIFVGEDNRWHISVSWVVVLCIRKELQERDSMWKLMYCSMENMWWKFSLLFGL